MNVNKLANSEGLNLFSSKKNKNAESAELKATIEMLSTSIESINQRLSSTNLDESFNTALKEFLPRVHKMLQYLDQKVDKTQKDITVLNNNFYKFEKNLSTSMNNLKQTVTQQNTKINEAMDKVEVAQTTTIRTVENSNAHFKKKLDQMIEIHLQEIKLMKDQNVNFVKRMDSLESAIRDFLKNYE